ncbi:unnamed protein product [Oikopleura dioica]|uniref:Uncharacterized protein n=1 Tax=Oikopleura dioica TaxID=34765 RepID=E4XMY3_OIKDI|nr:unnamed protein product [Oikopleura dioica]
MNEEENKRAYTRNNNQARTTPTPNPSISTTPTPNPSISTTPITIMRAETEFQPIFLRNHNLTDTINNLPLLIEGEGRAYYLNPIGKDVFEVLFSLQILVGNAPIARIESDSYGVSVFYKDGHFIQYLRF